MKRGHAAKRTLLIPGVDMSKQPQPTPIVDINKTLRFSWRTGGWPPARHLVGGSNQSLCGALGASDWNDRITHGGVYGRCSACLVEASKLSAVVR